MVGPNRFGLNIRDYLLDSNGYYKGVFALADNNNNIMCNGYEYGLGTNGSFNTTYNKVFAPWTNPSTHTWGNQPTNFEMQVISQNGNTIHAHFYLGNMTITENTTLSAGTYHFNGNITVASGITLTIDPGATLVFSDGTSLTSHGMITAVGTSSQPVTFTGNSWGTISLSGSGANGSTFGYVNVQNNTSLSASNVSNVSIQNCTFTNSTGNAIAFSSSSGSVTNTTITNSNTNGNGIWISSSSSVDCKSNTITKTGSGLHTGAGIYYYGGSDGNATQNDISGFNFGLASVRFSSAGSHDSYYHERNNRIRNCNVGLMVGWGSYLYFGDPPPSDYMWNSIYSNTWNAKVGTTWPYQCGLVAYGNWWGAAPPPSNYQAGSSSYFYFTPYLSSDPGPGTPLLQHHNRLPKRR